MWNAKGIQSLNGVWLCRRMNVVLYLCLLLFCSIVWGSFIFLDDVRDPKRREFLTFNCISFYLWNYLFVKFIWCLPACYAPHCDSKGTSISNIKIRHRFFCISRSAQQLIYLAFVTLHPVLIVSCVISLYLSTTFRFLIFQHPGPIKFYLLIGFRWEIQLTNKPLKQISQLMYI